MKLISMKVNNIYRHSISVINIYHVADIPIVRNLTLYCQQQRQSTFHHQNNNNGSDKLICADD